MKRRNKIALVSFGLISVGLLVSGCTANFCTDKDKAKIAYAFEPGVSEFVVSDTEITEDTNKKVFQIEGTKVYQVIEYNSDENGNPTTYKKSTQLNTIIEAAKSNGYLAPSIEYFKKLDLEVLKRSVAAYNADNSSGQLSLETIDQENLNNLLSSYGYVKFFKDGNAFDDYREMNSLFREESYTAYASKDFENFYINQINGVVEKYHSCITVYDEVKYGNYNGSSIKLEKVTWKEAWGKGGHLIEGLIVYPVAWLIDTFALIFAGGKHASPETIAKAYQNGVPQILSIIIVTVIVRLFIFLVTFRSTLAQKKMSDLQPELAKIQQKYPNANTNQAQKQRLAEEQMRLYKKHKINPLSQLLVLIIQFPVFIGVWGAMTGSAVLSTGKFLDLDLSLSIWTALKTVKHPGWWTAFVLIILMSASQFFSMKAPQWIQKAKQKKVARLGKNPAQKQQNRTANIISYTMLVMIIIMGFTLPSAMGVYWFVGAIVSLVQTIFTNIVFAKK